MRKIILFLCIVLTSSSAFADEIIAREKYNLARHAYQKAKTSSEYQAEREGFLESERLFKESFCAWRHPQTAYFIAIVNYELDDHKEMVTYAKLAKSVKPPTISEKYLKSVEELVGYAKSMQEAKEFSNQQARAGVHLYIHVEPPRYVIPSDSL